MLIPYLIITLSIVVWALVPFRQYKMNFFTFFLILALSDPIMVLLHSIFPFYPARFYSATSPLLIFSLLNIGKIRKRYLFYIFITIINIYISASLNILIIKLDLLFQFLIMLYIIFGKTLYEIYRNHKISIFYTVFNIYILTFIFKNLIIIINLNKGFYYYYLTSVLEILIGIYFIFYNEKNSAIFKLKSI